MHAVPMRAAGLVLGALGLFGTRRGALTDADLLVGQTLTHIACVAILQEHAPTASTVMSQLRAALTRRIAVEQAKGFLRESLDVSVGYAFQLFRTYYAPTADTSPRSPPIDDRAGITPATTGGDVRISSGLTLPRSGAPHGLLDQPRRLLELNVLGLADPDEPVEGHLRADAGPAADNADRLIDHRPAVQRALQS